MTRLEAAKLVGVLLAAFPSPQNTTKTSEIYERMLSDLDYAVANAAVERLLATRERMPSIAEIRKACLDLSIGETRAGGEAWGDVVKAIGRYGVYRQPGKEFHFQDPVAARCVAALGWGNLCNSESQIADRARFIELYDKLAVTARREANVSELPAAKRLHELQASKDVEVANGIVLQLAAAKAVKP